jgi:hypothetical protein
MQPRNSLTSCQQYQKELESMYAEVEKMYQDFQAESVLLSEDMKRKREDVIISREKEYKDLQRNISDPAVILFKRVRHWSSPFRMTFSMRYRKLPMREVML